METKDNYIQLSIADGTLMQAYIALPANASSQAPGLLLLQEAFGVNNHIRNVADRFAHEGYVVIAPELFHRTAPPGFEISYNSFDEVRPHLQAITNENLEADLKASYQWLTLNNKVKQDAIFSVGYCLGGRVSFLANTLLPLNAAVSYYGGGSHQFADRANSLHGKHLFYWGGKDQHIKQQDINTLLEALDQEEKDYINVKIAYADHGFNCDERPSFNASASKDAWALTLSFLTAE